MLSAATGAVWCGVPGHIQLTVPGWSVLLLLLLGSIGCDGVGSTARTDKCGACAGDNTSCHIISGIFTRSVLSYGYNKVASIPKGACNVNITETKYSRNYLALKVSESGKGIINGDWRVSHSKTYPAAGTSFTYHLPYPRVTSSGKEYIIAKGPLTEKVDVLVLAFSKNKGITYEYTIPSVKKKHHHGHRNSSHSKTHRIAYLQNDRHMQRHGSTDSRSGYRQPHSTHRRVGTSTHRRVGTSTHRAGVYPYTNRAYPKTGFQRAGPTGTRYANGQSYLDYTQTHGLSRPAASRRTQSLSPVRQAQRHVISAYKPGVVVPRQTAAARTEPHGHDVTLSGKGYRTQRQLVQQPRPQYVQPHPNYAAHTGGRRPQHYLQVTGRQPIQNHGNPYAHVPKTGLPNPYFQVQHGAGGAVPPLRGTVNDQISLNLPDTDANVNSGVRSTSGYSWRISGFTKCSRSCGGGTQETIVVCVRPTSQAVVTEDNCNNGIKPGVQSVSCNQNPCPPSWVAGDWSACSRSCDKGTQSRSVACKQLLSSTLHLEVNPSLCRQEPKPDSVQTCEVKPCVRWKIGEWGQCSAESCGRGQRSREVVCVNAKDSPLPENKCQPPKPQRTEICDMGSCAKTWFYSDWAKQCSSDCGEGKYTRKVICTAAKCNPSTKPQTEKSCQNNIPCGGKWFTGSWGKCSVSCGDGVASRDVACMKKLSAGLLTVVGHENCIPDEKPATTKKCHQAACKEEWYMTDWSKCSRSCNTGYKTREVKCLDAELRISLKCNQADKPTVRTTCSTSTCPSTRSHHKHHQQRQSDRSCKDKYNNCRLVVQARLCRYSYYKHICCATCTSHHHHHHHHQSNSK